MNIIEMVRKILTEYPGMPEFTGNIHIDFTESEPGNFGLYSSGDARLGEDVLGNQKRKHNFELLAINQSYEDFDRLENSAFLLKLGYWLEQYHTNERISVELSDGTSLSGRLTKLQCANAMLYNLPEDGMNGPVTYQIQISAYYELEGE